MVDVGEPAPDFTLPNERNEDVTLSKELGSGPVVLSWYVLDFTRVCTTQSCGLRDEMEGLQAHGAKVFGISCDSPASHRVFKATNQLNYPLLSDWGGYVSERYGVLYETWGKLKRVSKRAVFVLDSGGVVRYRWVTEDAGVGPDVKAVAAEVRRLG
ncbi:MAG TPA: redoxin domain-containing protein [Thermoplasmata archaeon]|jgi:peroxiredoxin|nr:redoxin domain-containing protein [Thermoplasmata archaeon]